MNIIKVSIHLGKENQCLTFPKTYQSLIHQNSDFVAVFRWAFEAVERQVEAGIVADFDEDFETAAVAVSDMIGLKIYNVK